jgi:voltage-gated potassium channel
MRPRQIIAGFLLPLAALWQMLRQPETRGPVYLVFSLLAVGTAFYSVEEGWSVTDSLYFCAMTLATVGFGDLAPTTTTSKMFTVVYVIFGIGTLVAFFSALAARTLEIQSALRERRAGQER